ncbi:MAG: hypothetical protein QOF48_3453 [Verrucomicrobiota bacterium]|jgi:lysophospholipid acyltransferase (LPLAT)-like uncharacterized protein
MIVESPPAPSPAPSPLWNAPTIPHQPTFWQRFLALLIVLVARVVTATIRFRWERDPHELPQAGRPYIFCLWHNRLPLAVTLYRQFTESGSAPFRLAALVSASRDGAMMTRVLEWFGVEPARGSSSRRGTQALVELAAWAGRGHDLAVAADGPRGPRYEIKPGVVALAQMTRRPIVAISYRLTRKFTLKSWDNFQIPLPFSTCLFTFADPIFVPREFRDAERENVRVRVESELRRLTID